MSPQKPQRTLGVYGSFGISPEKAVSLYRQRITKKLIKPPVQWDLVKEGLDLFAIRTQRNCLELEQEQDQMKVEVKEQNKLNEFRLKEVHSLLQKDIHEQFIEINEFIRDCTTKEASAAEKIDVELKRQSELKDNIQVLEDDLKKLLDFKGKMSDAVEEFKCFEDTITELVKDSEHISTTKDFMDKCDSLMMAQVEISEDEEKKVREIEDFQQRLTKLTTDSATDVLGLNNFLVDLEKAYEKARVEGVQWEQVLIESRDFIVNEEVKFNRIIDSTRQLYLLLCKRNGKDPHLKHVSVEGQLDFIKDEIDILRTVLAKATAFMATEEKSLLGERGTGEN